MCHICVKGFLDSNFNQVVTDQNINFTRICPKFDILLENVFFFFFTIYGKKEIEQPFPPYKFCDRNIFSFPGDILLIFADWKQFRCYIFTFVLDVRKEKNTYLIS